MYSLNLMKSKLVQFKVTFSSPQNLIKCNTDMKGDFFEL